MLCPEQRERLAGDLRTPPEHAPSAGRRVPTVSVAHVLGRLGTGGTTFCYSYLCMWGVLVALYLRRLRCSCAPYRVTRKRSSQPSQTSDPSSNLPQSGVACEFGCSEARWITEHGRRLERADSTVDDRITGFRVGVLSGGVLSGWRGMPGISEHGQCCRHKRVVAFWRGCLPSLRWDSLGRVGRPFAIPISILR